MDMNLQFAALFGPPWGDGCMSPGLPKTARPSPSARMQKKGVLFSQADAPWRPTSTTAVADPTGETGAEDAGGAPPAARVDTVGLPSHSRWANTAVAGGGWGGKGWIPATKSGIYPLSAESGRHSIMVCAFPTPLNSHQFSNHPCRRRGA